VRRGVTVALISAAVAGCGSGDERPTPLRPKLPKVLSAQLAERSDRVAAALRTGDTCGALAEAQRLQAATVQAINARQVPTALQEDLSGTVNDLVGRIRCVPPPHVEDQEQEDGKGRGKHKGKGKHGKDD
jgi:hypothetical protein